MDGKGKLESQEGCYIKGHNLWERNFMDRTND